VSRFKEAERPAQPGTWQCPSGLVGPLNFKKVRASPVFIRFRRDPAVVRQANGHRKGLKINVG